MTTKRTTAPDAGGQTVFQLHGAWTRVLDRLTGLRFSEATARQAGEAIGHGPRLGRAERARLVAEARALERRMADTKARSMAEVILKLKAAACPLLLSGDWTRLVDSAARDLQAPSFGNPQADRGGPPR